MSEHWVVEAYVSGRRIEVTSDGTKAGTTYSCDNSRDGQLVNGYINYGKEFLLAYDGPKVKSSYTPLGVMAAISGVAIHQAVFTRVPESALKEIASFYAPQSELRKTYPAIAF
jgi:hypothetical protein